MGYRARLIGWNCRLWKGNDAIFRWQRDVWHGYVMRKAGRQSPGLWELQRHQDDISYHEDLGKNNRQKTEGGESI